MKYTIPVLILVAAALVRSADKEPWPCTKYEIEAHGCTYWCWLPESVDVFRGAFLESGPDIDHPCNYTKPGRPDWDWSHMLRNWGFFVMGFKRKTDHGTLRDRLEIMLEKLADASGHPEIENAPFMTYGGSRTTENGKRLVAAWPERVLCYVCGLNKCCDCVENGGALIPRMHLMEEGRKSSVIQAMVNGHGTYRQQGEPISWTVMWGWSHGSYSDRDFMWPYFDQIIKSRIPSDWDPLSGPPELKTISSDSVWLGDSRTWHTEWPDIAPASEYEGDIASSVWLPNADLAYVWRAFNACHPTQTQRDQGEGWESGAGTTYGYSGQPLIMLQSPTRPYHLGKPGGKEYPVVARDTLINIRTASVGYDHTAIEKIEFYDCSRKLGEVAPSPYKVNTIRNCRLSEPGVRSLIAIARFKDGSSVTSRPATIHVASWATAETNAKRDIQPNTGPRKKLTPADYIRLEFPSNSTSQAGGIRMGTPDGSTVRDVRGRKVPSTSGRLENLPAKEISSDPKGNVD